MCSSELRILPQRLCQRGRRCAISPYKAIDQDESRTPALCVFHDVARALPALQIDLCGQPFARTKCILSFTTHGTEPLPLCVLHVLSEPPERGRFGQHHICRPPKTHVSESHPVQCVCKLHRLFRFARVQHRRAVSHQFAKRTRPHGCTQAAAPPSDRRHAGLELRHTVDLQGRVSPPGCLWHRADRRPVVELVSSSSAESHSVEPWLTSWAWARQRLPLRSRPRHRCAGGVAYGAPTLPIHVRHGPRAVHVHVNTEPCGAEQYRER